MQIFKFYFVRKSFSDLTFFYKKDYLIFFNKNFSTERFFGQKLLPKYFSDQNIFLPKRVLTN